jgi:hypothetical protein
LTLVDSDRDNSIQVEESDASSEAVMGYDSEQLLRVSEISRVEESPVEVDRFPIREVVIMVDPPVSQNVDDKFRLHDTEQRAKFLAEKLEATDEIVESLFKDLREEQAKSFHLVNEKAELLQYIEDFSKTDASHSDHFELLQQQFLLLKYGICVGIVLYVCGETGGFLVVVLFLWLTLTVVPT